MKIIAAMDGQMPEGPWALLIVEDEDGRHWVSIDSAVGCGIKPLTPLPASSAAAREAGGAR